MLEIAGVVVLLLVAAFEKAGLLLVRRTAVALVRSDGQENMRFPGRRRPFGGMIWRVEAVAVQPDGRVLVGGNFTRVSWHLTRKVVRLDRSGRVDRSFRGRIGGSFGTVEALAVQPDGRILVAGADLRFRPWHERCELVRVEPDGRWDRTFRYRGSGSNSFVTDIAPQPDGRIVLLRRVHGSIGTLVRTASDGSVDDSFQVDPQLGEATALAGLPDGKLMAAFCSSLQGPELQITVLRLLPDGEADPTFSAYTTSGSEHEKIVTLEVLDGSRVMMGADGGRGSRLVDRDGQIIRLYQAPEDGEPKHRPVPLAALSDSLLLAAGRRGAAVLAAVDTPEPTQQPATLFRSTRRVRISAAAQHPEGVLVVGRFSRWRWSRDRPSGRSRSSGRSR